MPILLELLRTFPSVIKIKFYRWKSAFSAIRLSIKGELVSEFTDGWYFRVVYSQASFRGEASPRNVAPKYKNWTAWCAKVPLTASNPLWEPWGTEVWFEFGETKESALAKLKAEVDAL